MKKKPAKKERKKPLRIAGEDADVRRVSKGPLKGKVERKAFSHFSEKSVYKKAKYNLSMTLAHLLFPDNFPNIVAVSVFPVGQREKKGGEIKWKLDREETLRTTWADEVEIDDESREGIKAFYTRKNRTKYTKHS